MTTSYPPRRTGLGRSVADIVRPAEPDESARAPGGLLAGPAVVPLDLLPFPMLVADSAGRALAVNQRWVRLTGLTSAQSLGPGWLGALRPEDRSRLDSLVKAVGAGASGTRAEYPLAATGAARFGWWLAAQERAGERLVGVALSEASGQSRPQAGPPGAVLAGPASSDDPVLRELPGLLSSLKALLESLDTLASRLPGREEVPA